MATKKINGIIGKSGTLNLGGSGGTGKDNVSEDWTRFGKKQILSIGKKKQQIHDEVDEEEVDGHYSSSDEEEGRTSAVKEKTKKVRSPAPVVKNLAGEDNEVVVAEVSSLAPSKKKKKKGKKERAKEIEARVDPDVRDADAPGAAANDTSKKSNDDTKIKRKRKKTRSRQKNIYKDNRTTDDKPSHLVLGGESYGGRAMTQETKKKLGLETKTKSKARRPNRPSASDAFDSGDWIGEDKPSEKVDNDGVEDEKNAGESVPSKETEPKLAEGRNLTRIGDCIVDRDAQPDDANKQSVGNNVISDYRDNKKGTKQKKRKFKNLVVG